MLRQAFLRFPPIPPLPNPHGFALIPRHYVQSSPHLFDRSSMAKQNLSHRANVICDGSPSRIRSVRRISLGMTTRPRSSMRRTIPVAFIVAPPMLFILAARLLFAKKGEIFRRTPPPGCAHKKSQSRARRLWLFCFDGYSARRDAAQSSLSCGSRMFSTMASSVAGTMPEPPKM